METAGKVSSNFAQYAVNLSVALAIALHTVLAISTVILLFVMQCESFSITKEHCVHSLPNRLL